MTELLLFDALTITDRKICVANKRLFYLVQLIGEVLHGNILEREVKLTITIDCFDIIKFINFFIHLNITHVLEIDRAQFNLIMKQICS